MSRVTRGQEADGHPLRDDCWRGLCHGLCFAQRLAGGAALLVTNTHKDSAIT